MNLKKSSIDLSKLNVQKIDDLCWEMVIENKIVIPYEIVDNHKIKKVVEFNYYKDKNDNYWLSNCNVPDEYQQQGIGRMMIQYAIKEYGQVYFSNLSQLEFNIKYPNHGYDSRYLNTEGKKMVESLIRKKDIPKDWYRSPEV